MNTMKLIDGFLNISAIIIAHITHHTEMYQLRISRKPTKLNQRNSFSREIAELTRQVWSIIIAKIRCYLEHDDKSRKLYYIF
jgi:hypothetical protein